MDEENVEVEAVVEPETTEEATPETPEAEIDWKAEAEKEREARIKAEEVANNQKIRAEKAEKARKAKEPEAKAEEPKDGLSFKDSLAILNAKVHEDDVDEVLEYAKFKKISVSEALKSNVIKSSLAEKAEHRETAEQTSTGKVRSGNTARTGESILSKAREKGELPDSDADLDKMHTARLGK